MSLRKLRDYLRILLLWTITSLITSTAAFAQTQPVQNETKSAQTDKRIDPNEEIVVSFFGNLDIEGTIRILTELTGKKIIPSKDAEGLYLTVYSPVIMPKSEALELMYKAINDQGFVAEETDDAIYIKPNLKKQKADIPLITDDVKLSELDKELIARKAFRLNNNSPSQIAQIIEPLLSDNGYLDSEADKLIVTDKVEILRRLEPIVEKFDSGIPPSSDVLYEVPGGDPQKIAELISFILNGQTDANSPASSSSRISERTTAWQLIQLKYIDINEAVKKLKEILKEMGIDATNRLIVLPFAKSKQILVIGNNKEDRKLVEVLIQCFDLQSTNKSYEIEAIPLKYVDVNEFADLLIKISEDMDPPIQFSIYPIVPSNHLLVFAKKGIQDMVKKLLKEIDIPQNQIETEDFKQKNNDPNEKQDYEIITVKYVELNNAARILSELLDETGLFVRYNIEVQQEGASKQLIVYGDEKTRKLSRKLLQQIDTESFVKAQEFDLISINSVDVNEVADALRIILEDIYAGDTNKINIVPLFDQHLLLIFGDKYYCQLIKTITKGDIPEHSLQRKTFGLRYANPEDVKAGIDELFKWTRPATTTQVRTDYGSTPDGMLSANRVIPNSLQNQIIVLAPEEAMKEIAELIEEWDSPVVCREKKQTEPNDGAITPLAVTEKTGNLKTSAPSQELERIQKVSKDSKQKEAEKQDYEVIQVTNIDVNIASDVLNKIAQRMEMKNIFIQPLIEDNLLLLFGDNYLIQPLKKLLKEIDTESFAGVREYDIITLKYINAEEVTESLYELWKDGGVDHKNKIALVSLPKTNQLFIFGKKQYRDMVRKLVEVIDIPEN